MTGFLVSLVTMTDFVIFERFDNFVLLHFYQFVLMLIFGADSTVFWLLRGDCCLFFVFWRQRLLFVGLWAVGVCVQLFIAFVIQLSIKFLGQLHLLCSAGLASTSSLGAPFLAVQNRFAALARRPLGSELKALKAALAAWSHEYLGIASSNHSSVLENYWLFSFGPPIEHPTGSKASKSTDLLIDCPYAVYLYFVSLTWA